MQSYVHYLFNTAVQCTSRHVCCFLPGSRKSTLGISKTQLTDIPVHLNEFLRHRYCSVTVTLK